MRQVNTSRRNYPRTRTADARVGAVVEEPSRGRARTRLLRVVRWLAVGALALVALVLLASKLVHSIWNHERAGRSISRWASKSISGAGGPTGQGFTFGRVDYPWLPALRSLFWGRPLPVDVHDVVIWDPAGGEVLRAARVRTGLRLDRLVWAQLRSALPGGSPNLQLHFVNAIVDDVRCEITRLESGAVNIVAAFARRGPKSNKGGGMVIAVEGSTVHDGRFGMSFPGWSGEIEHLEVANESLRYSSFAEERAPGRPAFTYVVRSIEAPTGQMSIQGRRFPLDHFVATDFHATDPRREDMIFAGSMGSLGAELDFSGGLTDVYTKATRGVDLELGMRHGRGVLARLPSRTFLGGDPAGSAHVSGPLRDVVVEGKAEGFVVRSYGIEARRASARYRLGDGSLRLRDCEAELLEGHVRGAVTFKFDDRQWLADLKTTEIEPLKVKRLLPATILAYMGAAFPRLFLAMKGSGVVTSRLQLGKLSLTLHQKPGEALPSHFELRGPL